MMTPIAATEAVSIEIGGIVFALHTRHSEFRGLIKDRYAGFVGNSLGSDFAFDIDLYEPSECSPADADLEVKVESGEWVLKRGDFTARWHPDTRHGYIRQSYSPYA